MAEKKVKKTESVDEKKDKALTDAIHLIEKQFGKGSIMKLGDRVAVDIDVIPTKRYISCNGSARKGEDIHYGARPIKRAIQNNIEDKLAEFIIDEEPGNGSKILIASENDEIKICLAE